MEGRTARDQVRGHDKGGERAEQGKFGRKVEDFLEGRNDRKNTWKVD